MTMAFNDYPEQLKIPHPMNKVSILCCILIFFLGTTLLKANHIFDSDTILVKTYNCDVPVNVCIRIPLSSLPDLELLQDGQSYAGSIGGCNFDTVITYTYNTLFGLGNMGPYRLDSWKVNGTVFSVQFNTIDELVDSMNVWDPLGNWVHIPASLMITGGTPGFDYSDMAITALVNNTPSIIGLNFGLDPKGTQLSFEVGTHELIVNDTVNNCRDTAIVVVKCLLGPEPFTFYDTITANEAPYVYCLDLTELPGNITSMENICPGESGAFVTFTLDEANYCVKYQGTQCQGQDTACIVLCDDMGFCDTTTLIITVDNSVCDRPSETILDTILINFSRTVCLDTTQLPGRVVSIENLCPGDSGMSVDFEFDETTYCVTYNGIAVGQDEACFLLRDEFGNVDTTFFKVSVILPETGIIVDTITLGQNKTYCLDSSELAGEVFQIINSCNNLSGNSVNFSINDVTLCVDAESLSPGTDTACIVICDLFLVCDTTQLIITVVENGGPCTNEDFPTANDDTITTLLNTPIIISVLDNDLVPSCSSATVEILDANNGGAGPNNGLAFVNPDGTIDYIPMTDSCGTDSFNYVLCNTIGCDTALVRVNMDCMLGAIDDLLIFNAFSPNQDGSNDFFFIRGIENFPGNELRIFSRWGLRVFETKNYKNNWDGKYRGSDLPDGTYFYLLDLKGEKPLSGFVELRR